MIRLAVNEQLLISARRDASRTWSIGNEVLYDLCRKYPDHGNPRAVVAKVWLIGRAYSAAVERSLKSPLEPDANQKFMRIAALLKKSRLDALLGQLPDAPEHIEDLAKSLAIHQCLLDAFAPIARTVPRSFASKYLHFHSPPWFFIYDSVASRGLARLVGRRRVPRALPLVGDPTYRTFIGRAWVVREELAAKSVSLSTRALDCLLLRCGA